MIASFGSHLSCRLTFCPSNCVATNTTFIRGAPKDGAGRGSDDAAEANPKRANPLQSTSATPIPFGLISLHPFVSGVSRPCGPPPLPRSFVLSAHTKETRPERERNRERECCDTHSRKSPLAIKSRAVASHTHHGTLLPPWSQRLPHSHETPLPTKPQQMPRHTQPRPAVAPPDHSATLP